MSFPHYEKNADKIKRKVLFVRLSALGDVAAAAHVAMMLKEKYPSFELTWLVDSAYASLPRLMPWVDNVLCWDRKTGNSGFLKLIRQVRSMKFDMLFNMQGTDRMALFTLFSGIPERFGTHRHFQFLYTEDVYWALGALGIPLSPQRGVRSLVRPDGAHSVEPFPLSSDGMPRIALVIGASRSRKRWPAQHWSKLTAALLERNYSLVMLGDGREEELLASAVAADNPSSRLTNLVGKTSIEDCIRVLDDSDAVVSGDTGLLHIGMALGKPVAAFFGAYALWRAYMESLDECLCVPCEEMGCGNWNCAKPCLETITPEEVLAAVERLIS
ncbi:MAG: glycosyltransferase family 9 protein [Synergistaceae bacterium]|nr:glycosyltransferase family 9 protein [Synergistaceae bacterium]